MFLHTFAFRWKTDLPDEQKQRIYTEISAFQGQIPGLLETFVGFNTSPSAQGYEFGGVMRFSDRAAFDFYNDHPIHRQLLSWLMPLIDPIEVDFEV
jgi:hypothetical protein